MGHGRLAVHHAIATIAGVGRQVNDSANGISENLNSAGDSADRIPLVGDTVAKPLRAASEAALDPPGRAEPQHHRDVAGGPAGDRGGRPPILAVGMPRLFLRIRFFRRKWTVIALAQTPAGSSC